MILQSNEGLCWFSSVLHIMEKIDLEHSENLKLADSLNKMRYMKRFRKTNKRKIKELKERCFDDLFHNWEHQAFIFYCINSKLYVLEDIKPEKPEIEWDLENLHSDMQTEYALICILKCLKYTVCLSTMNISGQYVHYENFHDHNPDFRIESIYFDKIHKHVYYIAKLNNLFELTVDIGTKSLHSVILSYENNDWIILDPNSGIINVYELYDNKFKHDICEIFNIQYVNSQSDKVEIFYALKGILTLVKT